MGELSQRDLELGYCEEAQTYCSVAEDRYQQGKADAERDFQNSDYWNDYLAKVISDAKADAIDEMVNALGTEPLSAYVMEIVRHWAKKLKSQKM